MSSRSDDGLRTTRVAPAGTAACLELMVRTGNDVFALLPAGAGAAGSAFAVVVVAAGAVAGAASDAGGAGGDAGAKCLDSFFDLRISFASSSSRSARY